MRILARRNERKKKRTNGATVRRAFLLLRYVVAKQRTVIRSRTRISCLYTSLYSLNRNKLHSHYPLKAYFVEYSFEVMASLVRRFHTKRNNLAPR